MSKAASKAIIKFGLVKEWVDKRLSSLSESPLESNTERYVALQSLSENLRRLIIANKALVRGDVYSAVLLAAFTATVAMELESMADEMEQ